jgi:hypothetical protein
MSGNDLRKPTPTINMRIVIIPIDPAPMILATFLDILCPRRARTRKLRKGMAGIRGIIMDIR